MNTTAPTAPLNAATHDDKTIAIVSYLTLIGFVVAIVLHSTKKSALGAFHLRQSLGLMLTSIAVALAATLFAFVPFVGWLVAMAAWAGVFALWFLGLFAAIKGERTGVPLLGAHFQHWFGNAFE
jgi:uncharacterized membrane protein